MMGGCEDVVKSCVVSISISVSLVVFPELSFTSHNLSTVLDSMDDDLWDLFSRHVNIPEFGRKQAAIDYLISSHPAPSWRLVANALYQMVISTRYDSPHKALAHLQQLFPTGMCNVYLERNVVPSSCTPV